MDIRRMLEDRKCIYSGHIVGTSGKHLSGYCNLDPLMPHAGLIGQLTELMVRSFAKADIETVVVPAVGAIPFAHWGAFHLSQITGREVLGVWADKIKPKGFAFERSGFVEAVKGKKVLILEDVINQMFTAGQIIELTKRCGGTVVGIAAVATNKGVSAEALGVPKLVNLSSIEYDTWTPEECLVSGLCSKKIPIIDDVGHGDEFKLNNPYYDGGYIHLFS